MNNRRNMNVQVHYTVTAPAGTRVSARSISGNIRAAEIAGELSLVTISGDVAIVKGKRVAAAKTTSGTVSISDTESDTPIEAASISGDVLVHRVKAARMELSTISGKVVMQDVACDRIEAHSLSGEVEFTSPVIKGGRYEFNSHSGNVLLAVTGGGGYEVEANSWSGNVQSDVTLSGGVQEAGRGPRRKSVRGRGGRRQRHRGDHHLFGQRPHHQTVNHRPIGSSAYPTHLSAFQTTCATVRDAQPSLGKRNPRVFPFFRGIAIAPHPTAVRSAYI